MVSLSLVTTYIKHLRYSAKAKYFGPFYYIQIDPQDYDEWRITPPEEEVHFQTPSKLGSPATPRSMATSEASESYITLTNFKKGIKRDASAYPIFKNERYYNTFIRHFKATAKAQGLRPGLIEGECVENILHNGRCCADVTSQMHCSVLTIPLGSPRSPFSISPQC